MDTPMLVQSDDVFSHTRPSMSKIKRRAWVQGTCAAGSFAEVRPEVSL